jgi:hypothetical protein
MSTPTNLCHQSGYDRQSKAAAFPGGFGGRLSEPTWPEALPFRLVRRANKFIQYRLSLRYDVDTPNLGLNPLYTDIERPAFLPCLPLRTAPARR